MIVLYLIYFLAYQIVKRKAVYTFADPSEALRAVRKLIKGTLTKGLKKFLKANCEGEILAVADSKLGNVIKEKLNIDCIHNNAVDELLRGIRHQFTTTNHICLDFDLPQMTLALSIRLAEHKLKSDPANEDTMIIQSIRSLDDLHKSRNKYVMRVREWYGPHFPELAQIISDGTLYAESVKLMGNRINAASLDFSKILPKNIAADLKKAAVISIGTEVSALDKVLDRNRKKLFRVLKRKMKVVAPELTKEVGVRVGARLISHAASTFQILGAEKALFSAMKLLHKKRAMGLYLDKSETPKYGLIYHAPEVRKAVPEHKGKIARKLAAKAAFGDGQSKRAEAAKEEDEKKMKDKKKKKRKHEEDGDTETPALKKKKKKKN